MIHCQWESAMTSDNQQDQDTLEDAFSSVVEQYSDLAYNVALGMLRNVQDAEDAVQDAFISAYRAFPTFERRSKVSTWLYRIVVNACLMKIRRAKTRAKYLSQTGYEDPIITDWAADPERSAVNAELRGVLDDGLSLLAPDLRAVVVLRDIEGLSTEEAAEALDVTIPALKSRLHRARVLLRKYLEDRLPKPAPA